MKRFYEIFYGVDENGKNDWQGRRKLENIFKDFLEEFFETIKDNPNVLSGKKIYSIYDSFNLLSNSIWKKKRILIRLEKYSVRRSDGLKINNRESFPILFGLNSGICFQKEADTYQVFFINGPGETEYNSINLIELPRVKLKIIQYL